MPCTLHLCVPCIDLVRSWLVIVQALESPMQQSTQQRNSSLEEWNWWQEGRTLERCDKEGRGIIGSEIGPSAWRQTRLIDPRPCFILTVLLLLPQQL